MPLQGGEGGKAAQLAWSTFFGAFIWFQLVPLEKVRYAASLARRRKRRTSTG